MIIIPQTKTLSVIKSQTQLVNKAWQDAKDDWQHDRKIFPKKYYNYSNGSYKETIEKYNETGRLCY